MLLRIYHWVGGKMKEHTDDLFVAQVIGICFKNAKTVDEITKKIYKNMQAKNVVRVFQCCEVLMKHGVLVPKFQNQELRFQVDQEKLIK